MAAIVSHESHNRVFAIGVNNGPRLRRQPADLQEASRTAARLIEQGYSIDLGLGQINSKNLVALGLDLRTVFGTMRQSRRIGESADRELSGRTCDRA